MQPISFYFKNPSYSLICLLIKFSYLFPDKLYLKWLYRLHMGQKLHLDKPVTFNEKLQWLKLNDHNDRYPKLVDKCTAKGEVAKMIGDQYIVKTIGVWNKPEDIDFDVLPNQFVIKVSNGSGGNDVVICQDKQSFDVKKAISKLNASLQGSQTYLHYREWPYKNIPRRILAEEFISNPNDEELIDYKVHVFNGEPKFILVCQNRYGDGGMTEDFYSTDWELMKVKRPSHPNSAVPMKKPALLEEMLRLSKELSKGIPFVRTDFYIVQNKILFGEMTFYPASGVVPFVPSSWDRTFGDWLNLPSVKHS